MYVAGCEATVRRLRRSRRSFVPRQRNFSVPRRSHKGMLITRSHSRAAVIALKTASRGRGKQSNKGNIVGTPVPPSKRNSTSRMGMEDPGKFLTCAAHAVPYLLDRQWLKAPERVLVLVLIV